MIPILIQWGVPGGREYPNGPSRVAGTACFNALQHSVLSTQHSHLTTTLLYGTVRTETNYSTIRYLLFPFDIFPE